MVYPAPDMPHARLQIFGESAPGCRMVESNHLCLSGAPDHAGLRCPPRGYRQQSAMRGIDVPQQAVVDYELCHPRAARGREWQPQIVAVHTLIDRNRSKLLAAAGGAMSKGEPASDI